MRAVAGRTILSGLALALVLLLGAGFLSYRNTRQLLETRRSVEHTYEVLQQLEALVSLMKDVETGARGYVITGNEEYLQPPEAARASVPEVVTNLRELTADKPEQHRRVEALEALMVAKMADSALKVSTRREQGLAAALELFHSARGKKLMDDIRQRVAEMVAVENEILTRRQNESAAQSRRTVATVGAGTLVGLVLVAFVFYLLHRESTERLRAQMAVRASEARLRAILDNTRAIVYLKDTGGRYLFVNRRFEELFHLASQAVIGKTDHDLFGHALADAYRANDTRALTSASPVECEEEAAHDDGLHSYISVRFPLTDASGVVYALCGIATDITARKQMEVALREAEERLNLALKSAEVGTWSWNLPEDAIVWDDYMHPLFGLAPGTFSGRYAHALAGIHPDDRERVEHEVACAVDGDAPYDSEFRVVWPDASVHMLTSRGKVYRDAEGRALRMTGVCWDITERKQAEEHLRERGMQLEAANKELEAFSYSVSHDLRAPLRAVDGFAQKLADKHASSLDADAQRLLGIIRDNAKTMGRLIDDLLSFSRLGRKDLERAPIDMAALVRVVVGEARALEPDRSIAVTIGSLASVRGDTSMIRQVLTNLVGNAFKFTRGRPDAAIEIGSARNGNEQIYFVKDNGAGFDMQYASKLFGVFQRLHRASEFEGTGVGLAIVERIISRHGGRVWAEGKVDGGATFYFTLPTQDEQGVGRGV